MTEYYNIIIFLFLKNVQITFLGNKNFWEDFFKPKIVYGQFQDGAEYSFAESGIFVSSNEYILLCNNYPAKALLAFLNCSTIEWLLGITTGNLGGNAKIGQKSNFLKISIPHLSNTEQMTICDLVDDVLCHHNWSVEKRIDEYVYKHFNLSNDEINMIETAIQIQQNQ